MKSEFFELHGPRDLRIITQELPEVPPPGHLLARTLYTAISTGTELAAYTGLPPLRPGPIYPRLVGYCNVAETIAVGSDVHGIRTGDWILTFQSHRSAFLCEAAKVITVIPRDADARAASTTYLYHLGYNALLKGELKPGHRVAVVGLGLLGLATVALANLFGARTEVFSSQESNLLLAQQMGAMVRRKAECLGDWDKPEGRSEGGADLVILTSNAWSDWRLALQAARNGGTVCVLGFPGRGEAAPDFNPLHSQYFYDKQLSLVACGYSPDLEVSSQDVRFTVRRNCKFLLELIMAARLDPDLLVTETRPWRELEDIYETASARAQPFLTGILDWRTA